MEKLTTTERELVAIGAALASNCLPCIEHHINEARRAGVTDRQLGEAIRLADNVRKQPTQQVLDTALRAVSAEPAEPHRPGPSKHCCG